MSNVGMRSQEGSLPPLIGNRQSAIGNPFGNRQSAIGNPFGNRQSAIANPSGRIIRDVAITMDWTATILAAAGVKPDPNYPLDGIDLLPIIRSASPRLPRPRVSPSPLLAHFPSGRRAPGPLEVCERR